MNWYEMFPPCWADPLSKQERRELAGKLRRACHWSHGAIFREMADLYMDVTERAEVPAP